jgi:hypothetical protein
MARQLREDPLRSLLARAVAVAVGTRSALVLGEMVRWQDQQRSPLLRRLMVEAANGHVGDLDECGLLEVLLDGFARTQIDLLRLVLIRDGLTRDEATQYLASGIEGVRFDGLARQVVEGRGRITAPRSSRLSTAELLHEPLT